METQGQHWAGPAIGYWYDKQEEAKKAHMDKQHAGGEEKTIVMIEMHRQQAGGEKAITMGSARRRMRELDRDCKKTEVLTTRARGRSYRENKHNGNVNI
ncbi:hypothetical protein L7F22_021493 [Adiantum nelumboides]|nr:hypothetical protein [Adiantum nelumboides]